MRKPTIVGDNSAIREAFVPGQDVWAVPMGSAEALAEAITKLADNPGLRRRLADGGYQVFQQRFTTAAIARQLAPAIEEAVCGSVS